MSFPIEFLLFGITVLSVALFHRHALLVSLTGLAAVTAWKLFAGDFYGEPGWPGLLWHLEEEWVALANLFALLVGFTLLARIFEQSRLPLLLARYLPDGWKGGFTLLTMVFLLSALIGNIAAALLGATIAGTVFRGNVQLGFLVALVAAANAGGSGSVLGDTTPAMMWLEGVAPGEVLRAYVAAITAFFVFAIPAARQQQKFSPVGEFPSEEIRVDWPRLAIVATLLVCALCANLYAISLPDQRGAEFPYVGAAVIGVILFLTPWRRPDWSVLPGAIQGAVFLLALVLAASMMPIYELPAGSAQTTFGLGFLSAIFDATPLARLALDQGGYDWGALAYALGFGGSMLWFGSPAGVAVSNMFPDGRSAGQWLRQGWHVAVGYVVGFAVFLLLLGWHPR